jgi:hypothetical protein
MLQRRETLANKKHVPLDKQVFGVVTLPECRKICNTLPPFHPSIPKGCAELVLNFPIVHADTVPKPNEEVSAHVHHYDRSFGLPFGKTIARRSTAAFRKNLEQLETVKITAHECNQLLKDLTIALHDKYIKEPGHGRVPNAEEFFRVQVESLTPEACKGCVF